MTDFRPLEVLPFYMPSTTFMENDVLSRTVYLKTDYWFASLFIQATRRLVASSPRCKLRLSYVCT